MIITRQGLQKALICGINVTGPYLVTDEAKNIRQAQGLKDTLVVATSTNAVVAKHGSVAFDTSKAVADHLIRELDIEPSPLVRVNGVAPAIVEEGNNPFPRDRGISSLGEDNIPSDESELAEYLRSKQAVSNQQFWLFIIG